MTRAKKRKIGNAPTKGSQSQDTGSNATSDIETTSGHGGSSSLTKDHLHPTSEIYEYEVDKMKAALLFSPSKDCESNHVGGFIPVVRCAQTDKEQSHGLMSSTYKWSFIQKLPGPEISKVTNSNVKIISSSNEFNDVEVPSSEEARARRRKKKCPGQKDGGEDVCGHPHEGGPNDNIGDLVDDHVVTSCDSDNDAENSADPNLNDSSSEGNSVLKSVIPSGMSRLSSSISSVFDNTSLLLSLSSQTIDVETIKSIILRLKKGRAILRDDAAAYLARDVTYKVKLIMQEATKFMEMGKRKAINASDIHLAVKLVKAEQPLFGIGVPWNVSKTGKNSTIAEESNFVVDKRAAVDVKQAAAEMNSIPIPRDTIIHEHWLHLTEEEDAPLIPWINQQNSAAEYDDSVYADTSSENTDKPMDFDVAVEAEELNNNCDSNLPSTSPSPSLALQRELKKPMTFSYTELIHLRGQSYGLLTKELEIYFQEIKYACFDTESSDEQRYLAFQSLQYDPNILKMVSYFSSLISRQTMYYSLNPSLKQLSTAMKMLHHLLLNQYIHNIKAFLHEILPAVMTCIVCSTISHSPESENHWKLRDYAAEILKLICDRYSSTVNNIRGRSIAVFQKALENSELDLSSVYGCLNTLRILGVATMKNDLARMEKIKKRIDDYLSHPGPMDKHRKNAHKVQDLISKIASTVVLVCEPKISQAKPKVISKDQKSKDDVLKKNNKDECKKAQLQLNPLRLPGPRKPRLTLMSKRPVFSTTVDGVTIPCKPMPIPRFPQPSSLVNSTNPTQMDPLIKLSSTLDPKCPQVDGKVLQLMKIEKTPVGPTPIRTLSEVTASTSASVAMQSYNLNSQNQSFILSSTCSVLDFHDYSLKCCPTTMKPRAGQSQSRNNSGIFKATSQASDIVSPMMTTSNNTNPSGVGDVRSDTFAGSPRIIRHVTPRVGNLAAAPRLLPPRRGAVPLSGEIGSIIPSPRVHHSLTAQATSAENSLSTSPATCYTIKQVNVNGVNEFHLQPVYLNEVARPRLLSSSLRKIGTAIGTGNSVSTQVTTPLPALVVSSNVVSSFSSTTNQMTLASSSSISSVSPQPRLIPSSTSLTLTEKQKPMAETADENPGPNPVEPEAEKETHAKELSVNGEFP